MWPSLKRSNYRSLPWTSDFAGRMESPANFSGLASSSSSFKIRLLGALDFRRDLAIVQGGHQRDAAQASSAAITADQVLAKAAKRHKTRVTLIK